MNAGKRSPITLIITFKRRGGANSTMPENATMPAKTAMPMFLTSERQKGTYGNMAESELLCVRVATLL